MRISTLTKINKTENKEMRHTMKHFSEALMFIAFLSTGALFAQAPVADFSPSSQQVGTVPLGVNFTDNSTNNPTGWLWHFGDGKTSTEQNPSHTYNQTGIYTVSLRASNAGGSDIEVKQALVWAKAERVINLPESVDLNVNPGSENARTTRIYGDDGSDYSGFSVSSGDINGDGYTDVIIGAYRADPAGGSEAGETYIIYGSFGIESVTSIDLDGTPTNVTRIYGDNASDHSGFSVSSGDINGDGYTDVIIGAYRADPAGGYMAGETYIIYGSSGLESIASIDLDGTPANVTRIYGDDAGDVSGWSVSTGDINGDGFSDVIIGAKNARGSAGETYVIYGSAAIVNTISIDLNGTPANVTRIYGDDGNDYSGWSVSSGDINGDGHTDVIIGAYKADPAGGSKAGETYIIYGSAGMESVTGIDLNGTPSNVTRIYGDDWGDESGVSVSSGDINGDGYIDVIIGAWGGSPAGGTYAGETYVIYGSSGMENVTGIDLDGTPANVTRIYGDDTDDYSGYSVSSGDINGDGYIDVIIGAYWADPAGGSYAGETYIIYGSAAIGDTTSIDLDGMPANVTRIYGDDSGDYSGYSVSSGDINGDGFADVIIGALHADPAGGSSAGETYIIYGGDVNLPSAPQNLTAAAYPDSVKLNWDANSESDLWYYAIFRDTTSDSTTADSIASVFKPDSTYTDTTVNIGITYYYWVTAVDSSGNESDFSIGASAFPNASPVWVDIPDTSFVEDDSLNLDLDDWVSDENDPDSTLTITVSGGNKINALIDSITHIIRFTNLPDSSGFAEQFILIATDPYGLSAEDTIFVSIPPVNDAPHVADPLPDVTIDEDDFGAIVITRLEDYFGDVDIDDQLAFTDTVLDAGLDSVILIVNQGNMNLSGWSSSGSRSIVSIKRSVRRGDIEKIRKSKLIPVDMKDKRENKTHSIFNRSNIDNAHTTLGITRNTESDTTTLIVYPTEDFNGEVRILITATDDSSASVSDTLILTVAPVNDAPLAFNLVSPADNGTIEIDDSNFQDTLTFSWDSPTDVENDPILYTFIGTEELSFLSFSGGSHNEVKVALADIYAAIDQSGLPQWTDPSEISGTWTVIATDGEDSTVASNGPFILTIKENVLTVDDGSLMPVEYALHQNFPNPFNPTTTLRYDLPERAEVTLTIYDILGREVRTLVRGVEEPGFKSVIWDGTDDSGRGVGAGVYLYRIQADGFIQTRKMVLIR